MTDNSSALAVLAGRIDALNEALGRVVAWGFLGLVALQFAAVVLRYVFGLGWIWLEESVIYVHATLFMAGAAYTLLHDGHVRVDIFYQEAGARARAWVDLLGALGLLVPVSALILAYSWPYVAASWAILEGSPESGGIPALFLLKSLIPLFAVTLILQGLSMAAGAALALRRRDAAA